MNTDHSDRQDPTLDSIRSARERLSRLRQTLPGDHPHRFSAAVTLASHLVGAGQRDEADEIATALLTAPALDPDILGEPTPERCQRRRHLTGLLLELDRWPDVYRQQQQLLVEHAAVFGPDDLRTAATRANLARTLLRLGDPDTAAAEAREALATAVAQAGVDHPVAAASRDTLAQTT